MEADDTYKDCL